jgi:hypothetical protein
MTKEIDCCTRESKASQSDDAPLKTPSRIRSWVLSPQGLAVTGITIIAIGLALNWSWLTAIGAAPLILAVGPCLVMGALGLCMSMRNGRGKRDLASATETPPSTSSPVVRSLNQ